MPGVSESRANARRPRSSECSPVAPHLAGTSLRLVPRASPPAMPLSHAPQSARSSPHPLPEHPHFRGPVRRRGIGCPRDKSCRRARRSGRRAPPSPYDTAFSEGSGSFPVFVGSSPITFFLTIFESTPEVRVLCSAGITQPRRSYGPVRLPPGPPPIRDVEVVTLAHDGSPPITRITFPTCRAHCPGGTNGCLRRLLARPRGLPHEPITHEKPWWCRSRRVGVGISHSSRSACARRNNTRARLNSTHTDATVSMPSPIMSRSGIATGGTSMTPPTLL